MRNKIIASIISCFVFCCVVGGGIWAAVSAGIGVDVKLAPSMEQKFWGELSISVDGYYMASEEDRIAPYIKKVNHIEDIDLDEEAAVVNATWELKDKTLEFGIAEDGGPSPIVVVFELDVSDYMAIQIDEENVSEELNITVTVDEDEIVTPSYISVEWQVQDLSVSSKQEFQTNHTAYVIFTITQTAIPGGIALPSPTTTVSLSASFDLAT